MTRRVRRAHYDREVIERNMRRERITIDELLAEARLQQVSSLAHIRYAVLETSGAISFAHAPDPTDGAWIWLTRATRRVPPP